MSSNNQDSDSLKQKSILDYFSPISEPEESSNDSIIYYTPQEVANNRANNTRDEAEQIVQQAFEEHLFVQTIEKYNVHHCRLCECLHSLGYKLDPLTLNETTWDINKAGQAFLDWDSEHLGGCRACGYDMVTHHYHTVEAEGSEEEEAEAN
jgi:hypothetical protein